MSFLDLSIPGHEDSSSYNEDVNVPVPGGLSERPSGAPKDVSITAGKTEISQETYNKIIGQLQHSFKEAYEILGDMANFTIVEETTEEKEERFLENAVDVALMEAFDNGPIFEAVDRSDKKEVKSIVNKLRKEVKKVFKDTDASFYPSSIVIRHIAGVAGTEAEVTNLWSSKMWQVIGVCHLKNASITKMLSDLNEEFADILGDYKILALKVYSNLYRALRSRLQWTDKKNAYLLLVDKKVPTELKEFQTEVDKAIENGENKEQAIKEYEEYSLDEYSCYIEATTRKIIKDALIEGQPGRPKTGDKKEDKKAMRQDNRDLNHGASAVKKDLNAEYKEYKKWCKENNVDSKEIKSKKEFIEERMEQFKKNKNSYPADFLPNIVGKDEVRAKRSKKMRQAAMAEACSELYLDDMSRSIVPLCEKSARRELQDKIEDMVRKGMSEEDQEVLKSVVHKVSNKTASYVKSMYSAHKSACKKKGTEPKSFEDFANSFLSNRANMKHIQGQVDDALKEYDMGSVKGIPQKKQESIPETKRKAISSYNKK